MICKFRNRSEVIISFILGVFFIILGLFILLTPVRLEMKKSLSKRIT